MLLISILLWRIDMSQTTITLPNALIEELMSTVEAKNKTEAVIKAIKDEIRLKKTERIKAMAGKMEFIKSADKIRHEDERLG
jgi:metal-responsive CopG/Arc/MetJ family transcriptional regulator